MKVRLLVSRSTKWAGVEGARHFLTPFVPDMEIDDDDPVSLVLFESAMNTVPQDFDFATVTTDKNHLAGLFGEEGIEIIEREDPVKLTVGDIIDIDITIVGRAEFRAVAAEEGD